MPLPLPFFTRLVSSDEYPEREHGIPDSPVKRSDLPYKHQAQNQADTIKSEDKTLYRKSIDSNSYEKSPSGNTLPLIKGYANPGLRAPNPPIGEMIFDQEIIAKFAGKSNLKIENTTSFDLNVSIEEYDRRFRERLEGGVWKYPPEAVRHGIYGDLIIRYTIKRDGKLGGVELIRTSGYRILDEAALKALKDGEPYWPFPEGWGKEELTFIKYFIYTLYEYHIY